MSQFRIADYRIKCEQRALDAAYALMPIAQGRTGERLFLESGEHTARFIRCMVEEITEQLHGAAPRREGFDLWGLLIKGSNYLRELRRLGDPELTKAVGEMVKHLLALLAAHNFDGEGHAPPQGEFRYDLHTLFSDLQTPEDLRDVLLSN